MEGLSIAQILCTYFVFAIFIFSLAYIAHEIDVVISAKKFAEMTTNLKNNIDIDID